MFRYLMYLFKLLVVGNCLIACNGSTSTPVSNFEPTSANISPPASGKVYYVAVNEPGASDTNNGLFPTHQGGLDGPWLSIEHAANRAQAGDTVYVRAGVYYESGITFAHSGAPGAPITLVNYQSEAVVIDGSTTKEEIPGIWISEGYGYYVIQGFIIRYMINSGIATDGDTTEAYRGIIIRDCILHDNGWSGIELAAVDSFVVESVEAYNNAFYGLNITSSDGGTLSPANGLVQNSSFHHHTGDEGHGLAINQGHDIIVRNSLAFHNTIHGFDVSDWPKKGEVSFNIIVEGNQSYENGVAGFAINSDSHHVIYQRNLAYRNGADWADRGSSSGFLCYEGCWHVEWYNNVSLENTDAGFYIEKEIGRYSKPKDYRLVFKNNIAYGNGRPEWDVHFGLVVEGKHWQVDAAHNNWFGMPEKNTPVVAIQPAGGRWELYNADDVNRGAFQEGNISIDPLFLDPEVPDVYLQSGSPCIDTGVDVGLPYTGEAPDMGVFEYLEK